MKDRVDIYKFLPLPNDPDEKERRVLSGKQAMIDRFKKKGYLKVKEGDSSKKKKTDPHTVK